MSASAPCKTKFGSQLEWGCPGAAAAQGGRGPLQQTPVPSLSQGTSPPGDQRPSSTRLSSHPGTTTRTSQKIPGCHLHPLRQPGEPLHRCRPAAAFAKSSGSLLFTPALLMWPRQRDRVTGWAPGDFCRSSSASWQWHLPR